tara:strand:- start:389 stop:544 length:156 start_codon:yes stop_codon:yes gene_type:complete
MVLEENIFIISIMILAALTIVFKKNNNDDFSHPHTKKSPLRRSSRLANKNN